MNQSGRIDRTQRCWSYVWTVFKSNVRETWRVILVSVSWHILYRITAHPRGAFISVGDSPPPETILLLLTTWTQISIPPLQVRGALSGGWGGMLMSVGVESSHWQIAKRLRSWASSEARPCQQSCRDGLRMSALRIRCFYRKPPNSVFNQIKIVRKLNRMTENIPS